MLSLAHIEIQSTVNNAPFQQRGEAAAGVTLGLPATASTEVELSSSVAGRHHLMPTRSGHLH